MEEFAVTLPVVLTGSITVLIAILVNYHALRIYRPSADDSSPRGRWQCSPEMLGGFSYWQLALVSVAGLFLELLMIRWISSEIRLFAFFKNFVLVACFLGFGLGCYLSRRPIHLSVMLLSLVTLACVCSLPLPSLHHLVNGLPILVGAVSEVNIAGVPSLPLNAHTLLLLLGALFFVIPIFGLIAFVFVPIGQLVGWLLEHATHGITAYTVNILGSLFGIALYTLLCFLWQPPAVWFLVAALMIACLFWTLPLWRWLSVLAFLVCIGLVSVGDPSGGATYWTPYQKLIVRPISDRGEVVAYEFIVNGGWLQRIVNLSPDFAASHPRLFGNTPLNENPYNLPYRFYPSPASVLVLGSGAGNDVAAALRNGAARVTAVEIDPLILKLGRDLHFEHPYSSQRVHAVVDDARSYIENTTERFDLIVYSLLDSHTTSSYYSSIRIDNYVYTVEALRAAKKLLQPDGLLIIKFGVKTPWIAARLSGLIRDVFGDSFIHFGAAGSSYLVAGGTFFIAGSHQRLDRALSDPQLAAYLSQHAFSLGTVPTLTTDDWPYFYQHEPGLPASVIVISFALILIAWRFLRRTGGGLRSMRWHFFFLGAGFLLLEAQIISRIALLFGTTWVVNSIVIAGLMVLIVASNVLVAWRKHIPIVVGYVGIIISISAAYFIPLEEFFFSSIWIKALSATAVLCLPVFFAGIVFIRSFAQERFSSEALGSNLLGALVGGLLESLSMWTGIRSLLILAVLLYLASWIALMEHTAVVVTSESTEPG
ncbi:methyltransferase domain-containing protein [Candidatus Binatus soli]|jgi:spermidine synthase|uniref:spermine/spermidine synthase domain-containing protein n=1 Tax=Candidatus Binatus soli TaxID=1953413 RepID=UPI003D1169F2